MTQVISGRDRRVRVSKKGGVNFLEKRRLTVFEKSGVSAHGWVWMQYEISGRKYTMGVCMMEVM